MGDAYHQDADLRVLDAGDEAVVTHRFDFEEPEEYDPIWELGQLVVYCFGVVAGKHRQLLGRVNGAILTALSSARGAAGGGRPGGIERRCARLCSIVIVVTLYALVLVGLVAGITTLAS